MFWLKLWTQWLLSIAIATSPVVARAQTAPEKAQQFSMVKPADVRFEQLADRTRAITTDANGKEMVIDLPLSREKELKETSPSALQRKFRAAMAQHGNNAYESFKHATLNFPRESLLFFIAIGGVTALQMTASPGAYPMGLQQHTEHSFSLLGGFSFMAFMFSQGFTKNALEAWKIQPITEADSPAVRAAKHRNNIKYMHRIPYLAMTAGFFAQTVVSTMASDPMITACVQSMMSTKKQEDMTETHPCEKAFSFYVLKKHLVTLAPALTSMLVSTYVAGIAQRAASNALMKSGQVAATAGAMFETTTAGAARVAALTMMRVGIVVGRIGVALTGVGIVVNVLQMAVFYWLDAGFLNKLITWRWRNLVDGAGMNSREQELISLITEKKKNGWTDKVCKDRIVKTWWTWAGFGPKNNEVKVDCGYDLAEPLKRFQEEAAEWRMTNMSQVYESHQGWQSKLSLLMGQYTSTYEFYRDLVAEVRNSRMNQDKTVINRLDYAYPLMGVVAPDFTPQMAAMFYVQPNRYNYMSSQAVTAAGRTIWALVHQKKPVPTAPLSVAEQAELDRLTKKLSDSISQALLLQPGQDENAFSSLVRKAAPNEAEQKRMQELNAKKSLAAYTSLPFATLEEQGLFEHEIEYLKTLARKMNQPIPQVQGEAIASMYAKIEELPSTSMLIPVLYGFLEALGYPEPSFDAGRGFLKSFELFTQAGQAMKDLDYPKVFGHFQTPNPTDYLLLQTVCGPDADRGEAVVQDRDGFSARFLAPRLTNPGQELQGQCYGDGKKSSDQIYKDVIEENGVRSAGYIDYLKKNLRPDFLKPDEPAAFVQWWERANEKKMEAAYDSFGQRYKEIIRLMISQLWEKKNSGWNVGPMANGTIQSARQQMRFNLLVLGEMLKDLYRQQWRTNLPAQNFSSAKEPLLAARPAVPSMNSAASGNSLSKPSILALQSAGAKAGNRTETIYEWNNLVTAYPMSDAYTSRGKIIGHALQFQKELEYEFEQLAYLLGKTRNYDLRGSWAVKAKLQSKDLEAQVKKITEKVNRLLAMFGLNADGSSVHKGADADGKATGAVGVILESGEAVQPLVHVTKEQAAAVKVLTDGIMALSNELAMYGVMANAMNWESLKGADSATAEFQTKLLEEGNRKAEAMVKARGKHVTKDDTAATQKAVNATTADKKDASQSETPAEEMPMPE